MQCSAEGTPKPTITWRREDQKKIILKRKKNAGKKGKSDFKILRIQLTNKDKYDLEVKDVDNNKM